MERKKINGNIYILLASIFWSFSGAFTKIIPWGPISIACLRALIAAATIAVYRKSVKVKFTKQNVIGGILVVIVTLTFISANKLTTSANAIVLQYTMPIYIILYNCIFKKNKPEMLDIAAVICTVAGIIVFFIDSLEAGSMIGNFLALFSGFMYAIYFIFSSNEKSNPIDINYTGNLFYILIIPFIFFDKSFAITAPSVASILFLGIVQLGMGYIFFSKGIKNTTAVSASIIATLEPVLNPVWAFMLISEKPSVLSICAGIFVILTISLYNVLKAKKTVKNEI